MRKAGRYWSRIDGKTISGYYRLDPRRLSRCDQAAGGASLVVLAARRSRPRR